jgi:hypothetical protein
MRVSANMSVAASAALLAAEPNANRFRLKVVDGALMIMPTARVAVNNLPKEELKARTCTRDARKNTLSVALNAPEIQDGVYVLIPGKFKWFTLQAWTNAALPPLGTLSARFSKKSG